AGVMASFAGCAAESDPGSVDVAPTPVVAPVADTVAPNTTPPAVATAADGVLVSLSVPNMV
ncbi:MAG: hypothetical protein O2856_05420, partial [Planctomycetota bacterium]|nr:hypothetical protein [Planctomycetota bacterium]